MLKALEILGFKSFADRTRFEFPHGITVIVGPNGSGKSNVVDSIKWVLGEQSVKSLRGREMTDVIFNGSGSRRATNAAEITMTFDNSKHLLDIDTPEVHITRRVYRSGEGEYLVNRAPARLRDIRDLLSGTGMGTQAYSVIEQGKVDSLLQSSPRDRRLIFEEAAGISRFKVRKIESVRRLERVEQNLLRLSDIVDEVENRLRSVRAQANKAQRYKEYSDRLQALRTQVGLVDWKRLTAKLTTFETELQTLTDERDGAATNGVQLEAQVLEIDLQIQQNNEAIREAEQQIASNRERIAAVESAIEHERSYGRELDEEIARYRKQLTTLNSRAGDVQQQIQDAASSLREAEDSHRNTAKRLVDAERRLTEIMASLDHLRGENEQRRAAYMQQMRASAALGNETSSLESQVANADAAKQRCDERIAELHRTLDSLQAELDKLRRIRSEAASNVEELAQRVTDAKDQLAQSQKQHASQQNDLSELRQRYSGTVERAAVLEELVRRHEGVSAGVKEVLAFAADPAMPVFQASICGLVADLFHVSIEAAPLVEIALGSAAQHVIAIPRTELIDHLQTQANRLSGRVGFLWLDNENPLHDETGLPDLEGQPGVLGRADRFIETNSRYLPLAKKLLGRTWFVEKLSDAFRLMKTVGRGWSFVTLSGECLEPNGTLTVGPRSASSGQISRRSQLRALQTQAEELQAAIDAAQASLAQMVEQIAERQQRLERQTTEHQAALDVLAENRVAITTAEERRSQFDHQREVLEQELETASTQHAEAVAQLSTAREKRQQLDVGLGEMETTLTQLGRHIDRFEAGRATANRETTEIKVELAKCEERLRNLQSRMRQFEESRQERCRAIDEGTERLAQANERSKASQWAILQAESEVADLYLRKETVATKTVDWINLREECTERRNTVSSEIQKVNNRVRKLEDKMHALDLSAAEIRHERDALVERMREDYDIDLTAVDNESTDEDPRQREDVQQEIDELRQKINNIGNVNLESLDELESLETRFKTLSDQYQDLSTAKASLEKIIDRINTDSRRLFVETLETIRGHFQTLFRDLFGGGQADIVLEENIDILESGIEIVARPPGKEPRSISLLSGGEKTMTCVALLLAIFRSRPSPFCVLDEVDAALDEVNIDRFTKVIQNFLTWTQFIIITHSKKTMTCANTIYGVTMQESGVSKQVSVRFEDVSEDGHILTPGDDAQAKAA
jgi:chromosome segregation protein